MNHGDGPVRNVNTNYVDEDDFIYEGGGNHNAR